MFNIPCLRANGLILSVSSASHVWWCAVIVLSLLLSVNEKSATCENVNKPSACTGFTHVCESILCTRTHTHTHKHTHTHSALKAVSLVRPCLSFLSVNQCLLTRNPPRPPPPPFVPTTSTCTSSQPGALACQRKRKSMVPLSIDWQGRQQHVNHSSQAMADWLGHRSRKIFIKLITAWLVITSGEEGRGGGRRVWGREREMQTRINLRFTREVSAAFSRSPVPIPNAFMHTLIFTTGGENYRLHVSRPSALVNAGSELQLMWFQVLFTSYSRQHNLSLIDQLINLSLLLSTHKPRWNLSHLLTSLGCILGCNLQRRVRSHWHLPTMHSSADPTGACNDTE